MAKNRAFWIIVAGVVPTAFRAKEREELLPTLRQLQRKQPDTIMMWFEGGRFWTSPEAARGALAARRRRRAESPPAQRDNWRPGGDHKDPRARYKQTRDEKRARFKKRLIQGSRSETGKDRGDDAPAADAKKTTSAPSAKKTTSAPTPKTSSPFARKPAAGSSRKPVSPFGRKPSPSSGRKPAGSSTSKPRTPPKGDRPARSGEGDKRKSSKPPSWRPRSKPSAGAKKSGPRRK